MSSTSNPSRLAPVEHTHAHAQGHTLMETGAIHWSGGQPITPRPWQGVNCHPPAVLYWTTHSTLSHGHPLKTLTKCLEKQQQQILDGHPHNTDTKVVKCVLCEAR